ncbi:MAG: ABC transporter ATP-binding protein [Crenarchaeota archaeon]|nr:ABC transporter ATP-binding protein [Thermoproteota archaeon]
MVSLYLDHVYAGYQSKIVLNDITIEFDKGITVLLGPNGSGKTTLLRVCVGIIRPARGKVLIDGKSIFDDISLKRYISYLPHREGLIDELTCLKNILFYMYARGISDRDVKKTIHEYSIRLGLEEILNRNVSTLSRGQRRKVALLRVLLEDSQIILLDEPTEGLDVVSRNIILDIIRKLSLDRTVIYVTHDLDEALLIGDRICVLKNGRIVLYDTKDNVMARLSGRKRRVGIIVKGDPAPVFERFGISYTCDKGMWILDIDVNTDLPTLLVELVNHGCKILRIVDIYNPLEDILKE